MRKPQTVEEWREEVLTLLEIRFGPLPEDLFWRIRALGDVNQLAALVRLALTIESLDQLAPVGRN